ncbi:MAG: hypothetical protein K0S65_6622 [Labilithrix sp.]|nr:hypothetical protein [Labilithrix sp.]
MSGIMIGMSRPAVDPADPRAPSQDEWDQLSPAERLAWVAALPSSVPLELHPPEGDRHSRAKDGPVSALQEFFRRIGKKIYVSKELATYYPGEAMSVRTFWPSETSSQSRVRSGSSVTRDAASTSCSRCT